MTTTTGTKSSSKSRVNYRWRVVDIIVAAVVGVAFGVIFAGWDLIYAIPTQPLAVLLPGSQALLYGVWVIPAVLGALIVRKPGAAVFTELVAAFVEALTGSGGNWGGFQTILEGVVQGLGAEVIFAIVLYSTWRLWIAILAGAASGLSMAIFDFIFYYQGYATSFFFVYGIAAVISGAVIAGILSWLLVRALARTGALARFAAGRQPTVRA
jgi:energy-coupling factor transport system permease protein